MYREGPDSFVMDRGSRYQVDDLLAAAKKLRKTKVATSDLSWAVSPKVLDPKRISKADYSYPVIATTENGRLIPLDGAHRIEKARRDGVTEIPAVVLSPEVLSRNKYLEKAADMHQRHRYVSNTDRISKMNEPAGSIKYDGASYFLSYDQSGVPRFTSRRLSVSGEIIDRTPHVPHLAKTLPQFAGQTFNVELIHTGHIHNAVESPTRVSGLLNSLAPKSIREQGEEGPIRAVIFDVIDPSIRKFKEKVVKAKELEKAFGNPKLMFVPDYHHGIPAINALVASTAAEKREGIIVQDHDLDEAKNPRVKIKHVNHYNLRITKIHQELDKNLNPKPSAGAVSVVDAEGKDMGNVGTGFDRDTREHIWNNQHEWLGKLIKVKAMKPTASKLRSPVYWGDADGEIDKV